MEKIKQTPQQRANTLEALNVMWPSVPPENVLKGLSRWNEKTTFRKPEPVTCGTVACFGGWCAIWPSFVKQGLVRQWWGEPHVGRSGDGYDASRKLFGANLFLWRDSSHADQIDAGFTGTDHELVTHRLQWLLDNSKVAA